MKFLTKEQCPLNNIHSVPIYFGTIQVQKLVNVTGSMKVESEITFINQVFKGFDEKECWERFKKRIPKEMSSKKPQFQEKVFFRPRASKGNKLVREFKLKSLTLEKHLSFGIKD